MAQDNQNRDQQKDNQPQDWQKKQDDSLTREGRPGQSGSQPNQGGGSQPDKSQDLDSEDMDEDRDDDDRGDGSPNRRNNIG